MERWPRGWRQRFAKPSYGGFPVSRVRIPPSPYKFKYPRFFAGGILIYTVIWSKANCLALRRDEKPGAMFLFEREPHRQMRVTLTSAKGKNREGGPGRIFRQENYAGRIPPSPPVFLLKSPASLLFAQSDTSAFGAFTRYSFLANALNQGFLFWKLLTFSYLIFNESTGTDTAEDSEARANFPSGKLRRANSILPQLPS